MVKYTEGIDNIIDAISTPIRRDILIRISKESLSVGEVAKCYDISLPAISKNIKVLERANLISRHKHGKEYRFTFNPQAFHELSEYLGFSKRF